MDMSNNIFMLKVSRRFLLSGLFGCFLVLLSFAVVAADNTHVPIPVDASVNGEAQTNKVNQIGSVNSLHTPRAQSIHELYSGFYPLVEDTGYIASHNTWQLGFNQIGFTFLDRFSISAQPMLYVANTPNIMMKAQLYTDYQHAIAISTSVNAMQPSPDDFFSSFYSSRVFNPNSTLFVVPMTVSHSYKVNSNITFHHSLTDINVYARTDFKTKANIAYSGVLQMKAGKQHSIMLHGSEVGFFDHDFYYYGISYRYSDKRFFTQMGYFQRVQLEGVQGIPLLDIGFIL